MTNYEEIIWEDNKVIKRNNADGSTSWIPVDESNSDYQRYLRHLAGEDESGTL